MVRPAIIVFVISAVAASGCTTARPSSSFRATVTRVSDGDTIRVRYAGRSDRVRLIGINAPEVGTCYSTEATALVDRLIARQPVELQGDTTQARRDRYGRLLAYVRLSNGRDLGREVVAGGAAVVYVYAKPFTKLSQYRTAEAHARASRRGLWSSCDRLGG